MNDIKANNNHKEFDPVECDLSGVNLIEASAGTGKTYSISSLFLRLILEKDLPVESILVVTFTEAATSELKDRIRRRIKECLDGINNGNISFAGKVSKEYSGHFSDYDVNFIKLAELRLDLALRTFDRASIFTIHGFCHRVLQEQAFESGSMFDMTLESDLSELQNEIISDFLRSITPSDGQSKTGRFISKIFLKYLIEKKFFSGALSDIVSKTSPFLKVRMRAAGEKYDNQSILSSEQEFMQCFDKAKKAWASHCEDIKKCLIGSESLKKNTYPDQTRKRILGDIDDYLISDTPLPILFKDFNKLTQKKINSETKNKEIPPSHDFFMLCEALEIAAVRLEKIYTNESISLKHEFMVYFSDEFEKRKSINSSFGFNDLLLKVHEAISGDYRIRIRQSLNKKYKAALIDEFQDTDYIQYDIFSSLFKGYAPLFLIGDPKQSIYGFRGADIAAYIKAAKNVDRKYTLSQNWRSDEELVEAVNTLFSGRENPFVYKDIDYLCSQKSKKPETDDEEGFKGENPGLEIFAFSGKSADLTKKPDDIISQYVADRISVLVSGANSICGKSVRPGDIAILVRKHREGQKIRILLDKAGIPSVSSGGEDVFKTVEALHFLRLLSAIAEPSDMKKVMASLTTPFFYKNSSEIDAINHDEKKLEEIILFLRDLNSAWHGSDFSQMFKMALSRSGAMHKIASEPNGERILTNFFHIAELITKQESSGKSTPEDIISWFSEKITSGVTKADEELLRLESEKDAVRILTIHKSKGLEFPIVFCPFPAKDLSRSKNDSIVMHSDENDENFTFFESDQPDYAEKRKKRSAEELAESMRLLYVALTRAKHKCFLAYNTDHNSSALAYLFLHKGEFDMTNGLDDLKNAVTKMDLQKKMSVLFDISSKSKGTISLLGPDNLKTEAIEVMGQNDNTGLSLRSFKGKIDPWQSLTSFSGLTKGLHSDRIVPEIDEQNENKSTDASIPEIKPESADKSIFTFPKGKEAGSFFHSFLERINFKSNEAELKEIADAKLKEYGFDEEWSDVIAKMATNLINTKFKSSDDEFTLSDITPDRRVNEMGFYYPLSHIDQPALSKMMANLFADIKIDSAISDRLQGLDFNPVKGFMRGYIDMVFEHNGFYYLLDWKSNHIGDDHVEYSRKKMEDVMISELYVLQYHLYLVALDRYLTEKDPEYSYEKRFGGVFYVFLRGLGGSGENGVYYHRPEESIIRRISTALSEHI